jgi:enamine deaminase RidA (YjgF/YER057c/UK114 family)
MLRIGLSRVQSAGVAVPDGSMDCRARGTPPRERGPMPGNDDARGGSMKKSFVHGARAKSRAYSPAVITEGAAKTIWVAGHTGAVDDAGKSLAGDFDAQCRQTFRNIEKTLAEAGAKLADIVTMTVFLVDSRYTTRMTELRVQIFGKDFPASAAITVAGFALPEMMIEIQCVAVI